MTPNLADHITFTTARIAKLLPELFADALLQPRRTATIIPGRPHLADNSPACADLTTIQTRIETINGINHVCWLLHTNQQMPQPRRSMLTWLLDCLDWITDQTDTAPAKRLNEAAHTLDWLLPRITAAIGEEPNQKARNDGAPRVDLRGPGKRVA